MRRHIVVALFSTILCSTAPCSFANADAEEMAKEAFRRGKALFESMDYQASSDAFREAYLHKPSWKLHYNIGQAEASAKRFGLALQEFEKYLVKGGDEISDDRRQRVIREVTQFRAMVGSIVVKAPPGARIVVDGIDRGVAPLPGKLKVAAGIEHQIHMEHDGEASVSHTVVVSGGDIARITFSEDEEKPITPEAVEPVEEVLESVDEEKSVLKIWGWVGVGLGGALLIGGGATGISTLSLNGELEDECIKEQCLPDSHDKLERRNALAIASDVLLGVGAAVAIAGAALLIVEAVVKEAPDETIAVVPSIGDGSAGLAISGRF